MHTQRTRAEDLHFPMTNPALYHLIMYIHLEELRSTYSSKNDIPQREFRISVSEARAKEKLKEKWRGERTRERTRKKCAGEPLIRRPSGGLRPSSCIPWLGEYRLSVVRLGVLHSGKYLGIFEESRVPKKTVYFEVRRRDPSRESEQRRASGTVIASASFVGNQTHQHRAHVGRKYTKGKMLRGALPIENVTAPLCVFRAHFLSRASRISECIISIFYFRDTQETHHHYN